MTNINEISELVGNRQFQSAKNLIEEALKFDTNNIELLKLAGLTYVNLELWISAQKQFETVVKFEVSDATSWFYLAKCYEKLGDLISAKNAYIKVIDLREEYLEAYNSLCVILLRMNEVDAAIEFATKAMKYDGENDIYDFIIGRAASKSLFFIYAVPIIKS